MSVINNANSNAGEINQQASCPSSPGLDSLHRRYSSDNSIDEDDDDFCRWNSAQQLNDKPSRFYPLFDYVHLPPWLKDNKHIFKGYRINLGWRRSCDSACHMHNETVNVWTHLLAFLVMSFLLVITMYTTSPHGVSRLNIGIVISNNSSNTLSSSSHPLTCPSSSSIFSHTNQCPPPSSTPSSVESFQALFSRISNTIPTLEQVTSTLLSKAHTLTHLAEKTGQNWKSVERTKAALILYVEEMERKLSEMKESMHELSSMSTEMMNDAHERFMQQVNELAIFRENTKTDLLTSAKIILNDFYKKLDELPPVKHVDTKHTHIHEDEENVHVRIIPLPSSYDHAVFLNKNTGNVTVDENSTDTASSSEIESESTNDSFPSLLLDSLYIHTDEKGLHPYLARWPLAVFLLTAMCCLGFSAFFHLFQSVSKSIANTLQCLDYAGICLLITGSNVPIIYYGFYCVFELQCLYICCTSLLGCVGFVLSIMPRFRPVKYRTMKTMTFLSMGLFGVIPMLHLIIHFGRIHFIFWYLLAMGVSYISGAMIYLFRIPECFFPGKFDYWFHSHQLWHVSIFIAVLTHYFGLVKFYEWRMTQLCS